MRYVIVAGAVFLTFCGTANAAAVGIPMHHPSLAPKDTVGGHVAELALDYRGRPYVWGGTGPSGFDCSGFTRFVYSRVGIDLPHSSYAQWDIGRHIKRADLRPGDLVFFAGLGHVGLYLGHDRFIHAPHTGTDVSIASLNRGWYASTYDGAVRVPGAQHRYRPPHGRRTGHRRHAFFAATLAGNR
jgi:cell wall-associated NlpC family hydrolase